jgi:hypothetical protein
MKYSGLKKSYYIFAIMIFSMISLPSFAQDKPDRPFRHRSDDRGPKREEAQKMMESLKIWKITEELGVDEKLSEKLFPRVRELEAARHKLFEELEKSLDELKSLTNQTPIDEAKLSVTIDRFKKLREANEKKISESIDKVLELLTIEQKAKFLIIDQEFPHRVREFLRNRECKFDQKSDQLLDDFQREDSQPQAPPN